MKQNQDLLNKSNFLDTQEMYMIYNGAKIVNIQSLEVQIIQLYYGVQKHVIYNLIKLVKAIQTFDGHSNYVQGVCIDPFMKFILT